MISFNNIIDDEAKINDNWISYVKFRGNQIRDELKNNIKNVTELENKRQISWEVFCKKYNTFLIQSDVSTGKSTEIRRHFKLNPKLKI